MEAGIPSTEGLGSSRPTALTALQRKQEDEVQANLSAQASAAVSQPSRISFKDREMLACCTNTCRRGSMAVKGASRGCAGWHRMPAWRRSTVKPGMMRSSMSSSAYRTQSDPPQILVISVRSTGTTVTLPCNQPGPNDDSHASPVPNQPACGLCPGQRCNTGLWCRTHACKGKTMVSQLGTILFRMHSMA